jgi:hypothetical protein
VTDPRYLALDEVDADPRWLVVGESSVQMQGYPNVLATDEIAREAP